MEGGLPEVMSRREEDWKSTIYRCLDVLIGRSIQSKLKLYRLTNTRQIVLDPKKDPNNSTPSYVLQAQGDKS